MGRSRISVPVIKRTIQIEKVVVNLTIIKTAEAEITCATIIRRVDARDKTTASVKAMTLADEATTNSQHSRNSRTACLIFLMNVHFHSSWGNTSTPRKRTNLPARAAKAVNSVSRGEKGGNTHLYRRLQDREVTQIEEVGVALATVALHRPRLRGLVSHLTSPGTC